MCLVHQRDITHKINQTKSIKQNLADGYLVKSFSYYTKQKHLMVAVEMKMNEAVFSFSGGTQ